MKKELEALKRIESNVIDYKIKYEYEQQGKDYDIIKQALTPPTADEIVKELNELHIFNKWKYEKTSFVSYDLQGNRIESVGIVIGKLSYPQYTLLPLKLGHKITTFFMSLEEK